MHGYSPGTCVHRPGTPEQKEQGTDPPTVTSRSLAQRWADRGAQYTSDEFLLYVFLLLFRSSPCLVYVKIQFSPAKTFS